MSPYVYDLVDVLLDSSVEPRVYVNEHTATFSEHDLNPRVKRVYMPGSSIYAEWNHAARWAQDRKKNLLLLNDDIQISPCVVRTLVESMAEHPDYGLIGGHINHNRPVCGDGYLKTITPTDGRREITNWCVIARADRWVPVDERFRVWYGDDDMLHKIHASGQKIGILTGIGVWHDTSTTISKLPWVAAAIAEDQRLWAETAWSGRL